MRLFNFILGKSIKVESDFFGTMLFADDYFECSRHFKPTGKIIEIKIEADESGPTQEQVDFFRSVEDNYATISSSMIPLIEEEVRNWDAAFKIRDFQKEFRAVYLCLSKGEPQPIIWEIAFESDYDKNHTFTLGMADFKATKIHIDG